MMKIFLTALLLISFQTFSQNQIEDAIREIEQLTKTYANDHDIPSINIGVIINEEIRFINHGIDNRGTQNPTDEKSIFQIASVGKVLVGIVINDLILKGDLDKDESILTYLPDTYSGKVRSKLKEVTVRDLLNHRSGLPRQSIVIKRKNDEPIIFDYKDTDFEKDFEKMKLLKDDKFHYSNFGYAVLAYIAERVTGSSFEDLLKNLSAQYGMESTSTKCKNRGKLVTPYNEENRKIEAKNWEMGKLAPPSGLYSSVLDLTKVLQPQMEAYKMDEKNDALYLTKDTRDAWEGTGISYGYGLFDWGNGEFGHGGGMDGYGSEYWFHPSKNVGFVMLTSSGGKWMNELSKKINKVLNALN